MMDRLNQVPEQTLIQTKFPAQDVAYLMQIIQQQDLPQKEFLEVVLKQAIALTGSQVGYIFFYDEEKQVFRRQAWSQQAHEQCETFEITTEYPLAEAGFWGEPVRQRRPILINDYSAEQTDKREMPIGHVPLQCYLTLPIFDRDQIVATIGVGNKAIAYDDQDIMRLNVLMNTVWSIIERKRIEEALRVEKELLHTTLFSIADGIIATDRQENIVLINEVAQKLTGWTAKEAVGRPFKDVYHIINESTRLSAEDPVHRLLTSQKISVADQSLLISRIGVEHAISGSAAPIRLSDRSINGVVLAFRDVSDERLKQKAIEFLSYHDQLTGLYNRHYFEVEKMRLDTPRNLPLAIIMADINGLKLMNDAYGHAAGDELLKKAADVLRNNCRDDDIIARQGGDEFVMLLPNTDLHSAETIIRRIREECSKSMINSEFLSISFGVDVKADPNQLIDDVLKLAEDNMYRNKLIESPHVRENRIQTIVQTLYETHPGEREHADRVSHLSVLLGQALRMSETELNDLRIVSLLHDIGKISIAGSILNKLEPLTDEEIQEIRRHPETGYRILNAINALANLSEMVLSHHERWDGTGYPRGLSGTDIPLAARAIAISEACDVISSRYGLNDPSQIRMVTDEIRQNSGSQFDPELAELFIQAVLSIPGAAR